MVETDRSSFYELLNYAARGLKEATKAECVLIWSTCSDVPGFGPHHGFPRQSPDVVLSIDQYSSVDFQLRSVFLAERTVTPIYIEFSTASAWQPLNVISGFNHCMLIPLFIDGDVDNFVTLHYDEKPEWNSTLTIFVMRVVSLLAVLVRHDEEIDGMEWELTDTLVQRDILESFVQERDLAVAFERCLEYILETRGFNHGQIYVFDPGLQSLVGQCGEKDTLPLSRIDHPCVQAYIHNKSLEEKDECIFTLTRSVDGHSEKIGILCLSTPGTKNENLRVAKANIRQVTGALEEAVGWQFSARYCQSIENAETQQPVSDVEEALTEAPLLLNRITQDLAQAQAATIQLKSLISRLQSLIDDASTTCEKKVILTSEALKQAETALLGLSVLH
jgi:hypothetical protein